MNVRILVAGEADEAHFARFLCLEHGFHGAAVGEDAVGVFETNHFVKLHQVDMVGLQAPE